jgi:hypothetical protein
VQFATKPFAALPPAHPQGVLIALGVFEKAEDGASDQTLFLREDGVERSWEIVAPVLDTHDSVQSYAAGTWGPSAANDLIVPRVWRAS